MEKKSSFFVISLILGAVASSSSGQDVTSAPAAPGAQDLRPHEQLVEQLVNQLAADDWKTRRRAQEQIVEFGVDALPALQRVLETTQDAEVRTRADAAMKQIDNDRATGPSRISLDLDDVPLTSAFEAIAGAAQCSFVAQPVDLLNQRTLGPAGLHVTRKPFWEVVLPLCKASNVWLMDIYGVGGNGLHLVEFDVNTLDAPAFVSGAFLVLADSIERTHSLQLARPADVERSFSVNLRVYPEPKLKVLRGMYSAVVETAVDERGNSLVPTEQIDINSVENLTGHSGWPWDVYINLQDTDTTGKKLVKLKGKTRYVVQAKGESAEFVDVLKANGKSLDLAGARVLLESVTRRVADTTLFDFRLSIEQRNMPQDVWDHLTTSDSGQIITLVDAMGRQLMIGDSSGEFDGTKMNFSLSFRADNPMLEEHQQPGEPVTLKLEVPVEMRVIDVPFEFNDLPIP